MAMIAVAEDDLVSRMMIHAIISKMGHTALLFRDGSAAWQFLEDNPKLVSLLVTDLMMPEMDGHELIQKVRSSDKLKELPIIVESAYVGVKGIAALLEEGATVVLSKPIEAIALQKYVSDLLGENGEGGEAEKPAIAQAQ